MDIPTILETNSKEIHLKFQISKDIIQKTRCIDFNITNSRQKSLCHCRTILSDYGCMWFKDLKPKHIAREIVSRILYIKIEFLKK